MYDDSVSDATWEQDIRTNLCKQIRLHVLNAYTNNACIIRLHKKIAQTFEPTYRDYMYEFKHAFDYIYRFALMYQAEAGSDKYPSRLVSAKDMSKGKNDQISNLLLEIDQRPSDGLMFA